MNGKNKCVYKHVNKHVFICEHNLNEYLKIDIFLKESPPFYFMYVNQIIIYNSRMSY